MDVGPATSRLLLEGTVDEKEETMSEQVIYALAAILAGLALGSLPGRADTPTRRLPRSVVAPSRAWQALRQAFVFWVVLALGNAG